MNRELLQQALDALEFPHDSEWSNKAKTIEALQHALTQPEQEPYFCKDCGKGLLGEGHIHTCSPQVKRQWVGLTDDEKESVYKHADAENHQLSKVVSAVEWLLKDKNTT
jgi:hypothetical protein